jgi:hypothetical protein
VIEDSLSVGSALTDAPLNPLHSSANCTNIAVLDLGMPWGGAGSAGGCGLGWQGTGVGGRPPPRSGRAPGGADGEQGEAGLVWVGARQDDLDPGDHFGDPGRDPRVEPAGRLLIRARRKVSNWTSRQNEVFGARPRRVCRSQ